MLKIAASNCIWSKFYGILRFSMWGKIIELNLKKFIEFFKLHTLNTTLDIDYRK